MSTTSTTPFVRVDGSVPAGLEPSHRDARRAPGQPPVGPVASEWHDGYRHGYRHGERDGFERGQRAAWERLDALQAYAASVSRMVATRPSYADLAERRGEHDRAERQRAILRTRGIWPMSTGGGDAA